ncbi:hypothetical protein CAP35_14545 [Chitinophagaceae bacterium IBVUCB1]|nr:hypothetical protein CAP35_14545 [Chitinophagaceae bacterium IBVUCB1]
MKRLLTAYASFTRTERTGILVLLAIIILLIISKATMYIWVQPSFDDAKQTTLRAKWEAHNKQSSNTSTSGNEATITTSPILFKFDPNTVSGAELKQLGLSEKTIAIFINWRSKGKKFYYKEDFKALYTLSDADYQRLAPHIHIQVKRINLNTADSATLVALPGIGPKLAYKILDYKKEIGSYHSIQQLKDVYHFPDSTFRILEQRLKVD